MYRFPIICFIHSPADGPLGHSSFKKRGILWSEPCPLWSGSLQSPWSPCPRRLSPTHSHGDSIKTEIVSLLYSVSSRVEAKVLTSPTYSLHRSLLAFCPHLPLSLPHCPTHCPPAAPSPGCWFLHHALPCSNSGWTPILCLGCSLRLDAPPPDLHAAPPLASIGFLLQHLLLGGPPPSRTPSTPNTPNTSHLPSLLSFLHSSDHRLTYPIIYLCAMFVGCLPPPHVTSPRAGTLPCSRLQAQHLAQCLAHSSCSVGSWKRIGLLASQFF